MKRTVYLDNAATTRLYPEALRKMLPFMDGIYGNPSSGHAFGRKALDAVNYARNQVASLIGASADEIYFTSGGTESNNLALTGCAGKFPDKKHIITSLVEHNAIINVCEALQSQGYDTTYVTPEKDGRISPEKVEKAIRYDTFIISIMTANNEVGSINNLSAIGKIAKKKGILFHTDSVAACGHIPINVKAKQIDMLSASSHKFGGPKGCGFIYIRKGVSISPIILGGSQEGNLRAGTLNVPGIVGTGEAARICELNMAYHNTKTALLRDALIGKILHNIPHARLNGVDIYGPERSSRLPGNAHISFANVNQAALVNALSDNGIYVSSASACKKNSNVPSRVLLSMGYNESEAQGSVRFTLSDEICMDDIDYTVSVIRSVVSSLRNNQ